MSFKLFTTKGVRLVVFIFILIGLLLTSERPVSFLVQFGAFIPETVVEQQQKNAANFSWLSPAVLNQTQTHLVAVEQNKTANLTKLSSPILNPNQAHHAARIPKILPRFIGDYIKFHRANFDINGDLKQGVRYLVYECKGNQTFQVKLKRHCGGIGDRLHGIFHLFYLAICTERVLLIDSTFPFALQNFLEPAYLAWNASFPASNNTVYNLHNLHIPWEELLSSKQGVRFEHSHIFSLSTWDSDYMKSHFEQKGLRQPQFANKQDLDIALSVWAFQSLFQFSGSVRKRALALKRSALLPSDVPNETVPPYISAHLRTGDKKFKFDQDIKRKRFRAMGPQLYRQFLDCIQQLQTSLSPHQIAPLNVYLASDDSEVKGLLKEWDSSIHTPSAMTISHVDVPVAANKDNDAAFQGMLDAWAELVVLMDSECIVVSASQFGELAGKLSNKTCRIPFPSGGSKTLNCTYTW